MQTYKSRDLEGALKELEFRMAVTTAILRTLDLDYVLYVILSGITSRDGLGFNRAFLFLDDDDGRSLKVKLAVGPQSGEEAARIWTEIEKNEVNFPDLLPRFEAFLNDTSSQALTRQMAAFALPLSRLEALGASVDTNEPARELSLSAALARCMIGRVPFRSDTLTLREEVGGGAGVLMEFRNVAIVPLLVETRLIGAIVADNLFTAHPVGPDQLRSLHALGNLAALAIDRARLHAQTVAMAEVDGLTGVYNRRHYSRALDKAIESAERTGQALSIVLFDLDHFKRVNDEHGHLVGDELLKDIARLLDSDIRGSDMVARYGGEEFVVLLKNTAEDAAVQVAEKLRNKVKTSSLAGGRVVGLTLSAGVAASCGGETAEALFERADRALYAAKQGGRDQVAVAEPIAKCAASPGQS